jgi:hypothetical protein
MSVSVRQVGPQSQAGEGDPLPGRLMQVSTLTLSGPQSQIHLMDHISTLRDIEAGAILGKSDTFWACSSHF